MEEKSYRIRIDMLKLKGASVKNVNDENGQPKRYLIIPIDEADGFYVGQKGCYFSMHATPLQNRKYEDTHCVRAVLSKDRFQSMTKEQLMEVPILGGMQVNEYKQQQSAPAPEAAVQAPSMPAQPPINVADLYQQAQDTRSELPF